MHEILLNESLEVVGFLQIVLASLLCASGHYVGFGALGLFNGNLCLCASAAQCSGHPGRLCKQWGGRRGNEAVQIKSSGK